MQKVILITGASSGFGKASAELLASKGHIVYGTSRKPASHSTIHFLQMDVRNKESIAQGVKQIIDKEGHIDVLVNNAGMGIGGCLELATAEEIELQMGTNFMGCVNVCQQILPYMRQQRSGKIINMSSVGGVMGLPYQGFYSASKFAIEGFSEALAAEVQRFGISVSVVEPGDASTNFTALRVNSNATLNDPDYGPVFKNTLQLIETEENGGFKPIVLAKTIEKIVNAKRPKFSYIVANFEQTLSVYLKRICPRRLYVKILRGYYES